MAGIDWSATGSMVGGIGSIVAVGVAVVLSELQHRRTLRLVKDQERDRIQREERETQVLAHWAATELFDLRVRSELIGTAFSSIAPGPAEGDVALPADLPALLEGLALRFDPWSPRLLDAVPRFGLAAVLPIFEVHRWAHSYDVQNKSSALLARTGRLTNPDLYRRLRRKGFALTKLVEACDQSYTALAQEFGFDSLEAKLERHALKMTEFDAME